MRSHVIALSRLALIPLCTALIGCVTQEEHRSHAIEPSHEVLVVSTEIPPPVIPPAAHFDVRLNASPADFPALGRRVTFRPFMDDPQNLEKVSAVLKKAAAKYPQSVIDRDLPPVIVGHDLRIDGERVSGSYVKRTIVLNIPVTVDGNLNDEGFEATLHHEVSSVFFRVYGNAGFGAAWQAANPAGFVYAKGGLNTAKAGGNPFRTDATMWENGFLIQYSMASIEEDFNVIAESLFMGSRDFWAKVDAYPRIRDKTRLAIGVYSSADGKFTEEYFRSLCPAKAPPPLVEIPISLGKAPAPPQ